MQTMNTIPDSSAAPASIKSTSTWKKKLLIVLVVILGCCGVTAAATAWWVKRNIYASPFQPVNLTGQEKAAFDQKVTVLTNGATAQTAVDPKTAEQKVSDDKRTLSVSEKEINAFLAERGLGERIKVHLAAGNIEATALVPMDKDVPVLGGKTLRLRLDLAGNIGSGQNALRIADVSVGGVPLPNAWLGDLKGVNLIASDIETDPVVKRFVAGIRQLEISDGAIRVLLNE